MVAPAVDAARAAPWQLAFRWFQAALTVSMVTLCLWGRGNAFLWLMLPLLASLARAALDPSYRRACGDWLAVLWDSAAHFAEDRGAVPWRAALVFITLPAALLFFSTNRTIGWGDSWPVIPTACSLLRDADLELGEAVAAAPESYRLPEGERLPYCILRTSAGLYSSYPVGIVQFALPMTLAARLVGTDLSSPRTYHRLEKWTAAWLAALSLGLFFLLALRLADARAAAVTTALLATASVISSTASQALWQHGGVIFWSLAALLTEFRAARRPSVWPTVLTGVACGMMLACRLSSALFVVPLGLWVLARSPRRALLIGASAVAAYAPWALLYWSIYDTLFGPSTGQMAAVNWSMNLDGFLGILFSPARGLFVYQPWLLLAGLAVLPALWRRAETHPALPTGWQWPCLAAVVLQILLVGSWNCWWGGHCWGSRLLAEAVPLAALLCVGPVAMLRRSRAGIGLLLVLGLTAFLLHAAGTYWEPCWEHHVAVEQHPEMLWSWSRPPFLAYWQHWP